MGHVLYSNELAYLSPFLSEETKAADSKRRPHLESAAFVLFTLTKT